MLVRSISCAFLVVVVEGKSKLCLLLIDFTKGMEIDELLVTLNFLKQPTRTLEQEI